MRARGSSSRCDGQSSRTSTTSSTARSPTRVGGVIEEADRQEAEDERPRLAPEPEVLVQHVERTTTCDEPRRRCHRVRRDSTTVGASQVYSTYAGHHDVARRSRSTGQVQAARAALDAWVREVVAWHFDPATGCPFWLDYAQQARLGSAARDQTLRRSRSASAQFEDEWLRGGPVQRWVPQGPRRQAGLRVRDRRHDRHSEDPHRVRRLPHRLRAVQRDAARRVLSQGLATG